MGRMKSNESGSSTEGVVEVSLKRSRDAATFLPIVDEEFGGALRKGLEEDEEDEGEDERRDRGLGILEGDMVITASAGCGLEEGKVSDLSNLLKESRFRCCLWLGMKRPCLVSVSDPPECESWMKRE